MKIFQFQKAMTYLEQMILLNDRQISYEINLITQNHFLGKLGISK